MAKILVENHDPTRFTRYYNSTLVDQYADACGYNIVNLSRWFTQDDIESFIKDRRYSLYLTRDILNGKGINYFESDTVECVDNKEFILSNNTDCDTTILTPDTTVFRWIKRDRIMLRKLRIHNGIPYGVNKDNDYKLLQPRLFHTLLIINPRIGSLKFYDELLNNPNYNVILGVAGKTYDKDYQSKVKSIEDLAHNTDQIYRTTNTTRNDSYACIMTPQKLRIIK